MKSYTTVSSGIFANIPYTALLSFSYRLESFRIYTNDLSITLMISSMSRQCCGIMDMCRHSGFDCISTAYPYFFMLSPSL